MPWNIKNHHFLVNEPKQEETRLRHLLKLIANNEEGKKKPKKEKGATQVAPSLPISEIVINNRCK